MMIDNARANFSRPGNPEMSKKQIVRKHEREQLQKLRKETRKARLKSTSQQGTSEAAQSQFSKPAKPR
jgi:hypothetical protein